MEHINLGIYQHFRGNYYQVINVARHSETLEPLVVYQALYGGYGFWVRPLEMFFENVEIDGKTVPRFQYITDNAASLPEVD